MSDWTPPADQPVEQPFEQTLDLGVTPAPVVSSEENPTHVSDLPDDYVGPPEGHWVQLEDGSVRYVNPGHPIQNVKGH